MNYNDKGMQNLRLLINTINSNPTALWTARQWSEPFYREIQTKPYVGHRVARRESISCKTQQLLKTLYHLGYLNAVIEEEPTPTKTGCKVFASYKYGLKNQLEPIKYFDNAILRSQTVESE